MSTPERTEYIDGVPDWLYVAPTAIVKSKANSKVSASLRDVQYPAMFAHYLSRIEMGEPLHKIIDEDLREPSYRHFMSWILRDPERKADYYRAQEVGAEIVASELLKIADSEDSLEDVARSSLRISTRKYLLGVWNKKRYGEVKSVELGGTINIANILDGAMARAETVVDAEYAEVESEQADL